MRKNIEMKIKQVTKKGGLTKGLFLDNGVLRMAKRGVPVAVLHSSTPERIVDKLSEKKRGIKI